MEGRREEEEGRTRVKEEGEVRRIGLEGGKGRRG